MDNYQPDSITSEEQTEINAAIEAAQLSANQKQCAFIVTKSLVILEASPHNEGDAVEIIQPEVRRFYVSFSR